MNSSNELAGNKGKKHFFTGFVHSFGMSDIFHLEMLPVSCAFIISLICGGLISSGQCLTGLV